MEFQAVLHLEQKAEWLVLDAEINMLISTLPTEQACFLFYE
jgi:hypothetical protein